MRKFLAKYPEGFEGFKEHTSPSSSTDAIDNVTPLETNDVAHPEPSAGSTSVVVR